MGADSSGVDTRAGANSCRHLFVLSLRPLCKAQVSFPRVTTQLSPGALIVVSVSSTDRITAGPAEFWESDRKMIHWRQETFGSSPVT